LVPSQPKTAIKSILASKSYGMRCHSTLSGRVAHLSTGSASEHIAAA